MLRGRCECGKVAFEVEGEIEDFGHCHCSQCRRLHGAAYATFAGVLRARFRYTRGLGAITVYASSERNDRVFCATCGSTLLVVPNDEPGMLYLSMSAIEGNPDRPDGYHAWTGSRAPWHEITDGLEQFEAEPAQG